MIATYVREAWAQRKGEDEPIALREEEGEMAVKIKDLIGDGNAYVIKNLNRKIGLAYGTASAGASCTVMLTCGQTVKRIKKAGEIASALAEEMLDEDMNIAAEWVEDVAKNLPKER